MPCRQRTKRREAFREYLFKTFTRLYRDSDRAKASADAVFALETQLARAFSSDDENRTLGLNELSRLAPAIDWDLYFRGIGATGIDSVSMRASRFFQGLDSLLRTTPMETWRDYLRFCLVRSHAPFLDDSTFSDSLPSKASPPEQYNHVPSGDVSSGRKKTGLGKRWGNSRRAKSFRPACRLGIARSRLVDGG